MKKILFVTSEVYPLIKTGGLADVSGSLPLALRALGHDVRILVPGYPKLLGAASFDTLPTRPESAPKLMMADLPGSDVPVWAVIEPTHFGREGNPYLGSDGEPWPDNADRFAYFSRVGVEIALDRLGLDFKPDIVHCNDWQTGLIPALLADEPNRPATVFTIHNLAYQGVFPRSTFEALKLPARFWSPEALEFYDQVSFIKGGLVFADRISTVSPTYAREIQEKADGCGLEGLLTFRKDRLSGIINGIDTEAWNPATDPLIEPHFDLKTLKNRKQLKAQLQRVSELPVEAETPLLAWVGRLVEQKGIDFLLESLPRLMALPLQIVLIGTGDARFEKALKDWQHLFPERLSVFLGYNEARAHLAEAGADLFLMPSRFEPCGLNQMYSQRYGALPLVRRAGGLADTVVDTTPAALENGTATGIVFDDPTPDAFFAAIERALSLYAQKTVWQSIQKNGLKKDFSWETSAAQYLDLYAAAEIDMKRIA
jgi:starch synthase